jgi:flagellar basal-body rod protein FlgB
MTPIYLFDIASQRSNWLSVRQATIAGNVANANTPGYTAMDVKPFEAVLQQSRLEMAATNPMHMAPAGAEQSGFENESIDGWHVAESGNSVQLEKEMAKAGEINNAFALNNNIVKAFHRMLLTSAKG